MTYIEPGHAQAPAPVLRFFGEPWIGLASRAEEEERIARAGLRLIEDAGEPEWRAQFCRGPERRGIVGERIVVAER